MSFNNNSNNDETQNNENEEQSRMMIETPSISFGSNKVTIYCLDDEGRYTFGTKEAQLEKDTSVAARLARM